VELSSEQLINCDNYDSGCHTGNMFTAFEWIHENGGLATAVGPPAHPLPHHTVPLGVT
jgi:hypothetical protein